jgi:hypothetical protein
MFEISLVGEQNMKGQTNDILKSPPWKGLKVLDKSFHMWLGPQPNATTMNFF